ncbi:MAG TPA: branched-chain amino acid ABC transporter ATP-binding protein/permease [Acidimicrobiales bacterium]|nr:branched-chain amino acid ABC transporter ATP-binding protein/permease [Acidimicrobiales bacterium]
MNLLLARPGLRVAIVGALALALAPLLGRNGIMSDYVAVLIGEAVVLAAAALSLNLLMGHAGQISLGHGALVGVGAFTTGALTPATELGLPFMLAVPAAAVAGALVAFVIGLPALRLRGLYLAVVTIAFSYAMFESIFASEQVGGGSAGVSLPRPQVNTFLFTDEADYLAILVGLLALLWLVDTNVTRTKIGRAFRALRSDEAVASSFGVDVTRYKLLAFALSGAMAGIAGVMVGHLKLTVSSSVFPYERSLLYVVVVVVGGLGSRVGVLVAAAFYAFYPIAMPELFGTGVRGYDVIIGAALLVFTMARNPGGLAGTIRELRHERRSERARVAAEADAGVDDADGPALPKLPNMPRPASLAQRPEARGDAPVVEADNITVRFGGLIAVADASLSVPRGRIVGLIGPNGAGKTTLFNAISGLERPESGRVRLLGHDVSNLGAAARCARGLGRTFQNIGLVKDLSVTENLLLAQHTVAPYGIPAALGYAGPTGRIEDELRERAATAISGLGFERYADTQVGNLSIGQQRIVELGCVLVTAPEVVMLDEPSAGMSPAAAENLADRLRDLRDELGRTVLLIEHNVPLVLDTCDELYVMAGGAVVAHGSPDDVVRDPVVVDAYLGGALT